MLETPPIDADAAPVESVEVDAVGSTAPRWLVTTSLIYLALPTLIFVTAWTRPLIAVVCGAAVVGLLALRLRGANTTPTDTLPWPTTTGIWGAATVLGLLSGAGAFLPQSWDWLKHNAVLRDLVVEPWPVTYEVEGGPFQLTYYIGYYLPAAAVGKLAGWQAANIALSAWTILGLGLAFTWFCVLTRAGGRGWILLIVMLFSGPDILGRLIFSPLIGIEDPPLPSFQLDWWAQIGKFPNHVTSIMWAPHHTLGAWIGTALILYFVRTRQLRWIAPVIAFSGLLSPFVTIGFVPLCVWAMARDGRQSAMRNARALVSTPAAVALVAVLPVLAYYLAIAAPMPEPYNEGVSAGFAITDPIMAMSVLQALGAYVLLIGLEVGVFYAILRRTPIGRERDAGLLLGIVTATMVLLPLLRYGAWSDLAIRAVVPSMFVVAVLCARVVLELPRSSRIRLVLLYLLVIGLKAPMMELELTVKDSHINSEIVESGFNRDSAEGTAGIVLLNDAIVIESEAAYASSSRYISQYSASTDTFFSNVVARRHAAE